MLNLVINVGVERGEELFKITIAADKAGAFLQFLGSQLFAAGIASMPVKGTPIKGTPVKGGPEAENPEKEG